MDKQLLSELGTRRIVILVSGGIGIILFLSFLFSLFTGQGSRQQTIIRTGAPLPTAGSGGLPATSQASVNPNANNGVELYQGKTFSLDYPASWQVSASSSAEGLDTTFGVDTKSYSSPQLTVATHDKRDTSYSLMVLEKAYESKGYAKSSVSIDEISAVKYAGIYPPYNQQLDNPGFTLVWETNIFFIKGNTEYAIRYVYPGNKEDNKYEKLFSVMLASLQFH